MDTFGRALPVLPKSAADLPPLLKREEVFNRYEQHTKHCPDCSRALAMTNVGIVAAAAVAAVAGAAAVLAAALAGAAAKAAPPLGGALAAAGAGGALAGVAAAIGVVATLVAAVLVAFRKRFIFVDYIHSDMH